MGDYLNIFGHTQAEACGYSTPGILESSAPVVLGSHKLPSLIRRGGQRPGWWYYLLHKNKDMPL